MLASPTTSNVSTAAKSAPLHLPHLDGLRGLAALFVLCNHAYVTVFNDVTCHKAPPALTRWLGWLASGRYAVDVFIVLSGVCLMLPALRGYQLKRGSADFFRRRVRRIVPPYLCLLCLTWLVMAWTPLGHATGAGWDRCLPATRAETLKSAALHVLLLNDIQSRYAGHFGYQLWTIPVEFHIYLMFPLLLLGWRRLGVGRTTALVCVGGLLAAKALSKLHVHTNITPTLYSLFGLGALCAAIGFGAEGRWQSLRERIPWQPLALAGFVAIGIVTVRSPLLTLTYTDYFDYIVAVWAVCAIIAASRSERGLFYRLLSSRPLVAVGKFSYSLYLVHVLCLAIFWHYVAVPLRLPDLPALGVMFCLAIPVTITASYAFHLAFERPFLNTKRQSPTSNGS